MTTSPPGVLISIAGPAGRTPESPVPRRGDLWHPPAVAEAGVIGKPDPVAGEIVKAFVALNPGREPSEQLRRELIAFARRRLGGLAPKEIEFDQNLPLTRSGKVMRRLLKARELGQETGDVSTLEGAP